MHYSGLTLAWNALSGHKSWRPAWRDAAPKPSYDVDHVGGGGHGLATAHYLAKEHGITNIAVLEKGWIGSGNAGRNTTIIRSNYLLPGNNPFYELSMKLWEGLEQDLNYNAMVSQRGVVNLYHSDAQRDAYARRGNSMRLHGVDAELLDARSVRSMLPFLDFDNARFPIKGGLLQRRGGTARHDAVVWGYARAAVGAASTSCRIAKSPGFIQTGRVTGVRPRAAPFAQKVGIAVAGNSSRLARDGGLRLPIESHVLQAFVTEGIKPLIIGGHLRRRAFLHQPVRQRRARVRRRYRRLQFLCPARQSPTIEDVCEGGMALMPAIGRVRVLRHWGGVMDMSMDGSPIIDHTPIAGSTSTPAGATAASRRRRRPAGALPSDRARTNLIRWRAPFASIVSPAGMSSTRRAPARSRTCIDPRCAFFVLFAANVT